MERGGLPPTLEAMSNLLWTSIQLSTAKRIAGKWIHLFKCTLLRWSAAGTVDWWVRERREWFGRARGTDGKQRVDQSC
jgi:hypothetical protein